MWPQQSLQDALISSVDEFRCQPQHQRNATGMALLQGQQLPNGHQVNGTVGNTSPPQEQRSDSLSYYEIRSQSAVSSQRQSRNQAEKKRRGDLNALLEEMKDRVPYLAGSSQKTDKNSILRIIGAYLRANRAYGGTHGFLSKTFANFDLESYMVDVVFGRGGFAIGLTSTGKIIHVTKQVKECFGYSPDDVINMSFYDFVHPDDHDELRRNITFDDYNHRASITELPNESSNSSEDSASPRPSAFKKQRRSFIIRMAECAGSKQENVQYEFVAIKGVLDYRNPNHDARDPVAANNFIVFHGFAYLPKKLPIKELSTMRANENEYITRHLLDARIVYCDARISTVTGYLLEEVSGKSAFTFMHKDDYRWTIIGLRQMYDQFEPCATSCYRLKLKTGEYVYLMTRAYLERDKTQSIESFVCINTLVSNEEGRKLREQMKERFSANLSESARAIIQNGDNSLSSLVQSEAQPSNPHSSTDVQACVEYAIAYLFRDIGPCKQENGTGSRKHERVSLNSQANLVSWNDSDSKRSIPQRTRQSSLSVIPAIQPASPPTIDVSKTSNAYKPLEELSPASASWEMTNLENNITECTIASPQSCDSNASLKRMSDSEMPESNMTKRQKADTDDSLLNTNLDSDPDINVVLQRMIENPQTVDDQLRNTYIAVQNSQQNRDTQLCQLASDCDNFALAVQRGIVTDCMVEHSHQIQMLETLKQAYQNWHGNANCNIGV